MPTYDYICPECLDHFEFNSTIASRDDVYCNDCCCRCERQFGFGQVLVKGAFVERSDSYVAQHIKENYFPANGKPNTFV